MFASTGVIGEKFPVEKINKNLQDLVDKLRDDQNKMIWVKTASSLMTTDTKPKLAYEEIIIGNKIIKIAGVAKGSGMISPNLGTMLSFIFTDADIPNNILKKLLLKNISTTFNAISCDSDTSTNDMITIFSTGVAKHSKINNASDDKLQEFDLALNKVLLSS